MTGIALPFFATKAVMVVSIQSRERERGCRKGIPLCGRTLTL
jgi:hypothetical protein